MTRHAWDPGSRAARAAAARRRPLPPALLLVSLLVLVPAGAARGQIPGGAQFDSLVTAPAAPPERVEFRQIFLAFEKSVPRREVPRSRAAADSLARSLLGSARAGADFDSLMKAHSDDLPPRTYRVVNEGLRPGSGERSRKNVEVAVGDLVFGMSPGQFGLVVPNNTTCRYGYYVIHRVR